VKKILVLILIAIPILSYCQKNIGGPTTSRIEELLSDNITIGDNRSHIEDVLANNDFVFNRYEVFRKGFDESCFRTVLYDCAIQIYIFLDVEKTYNSHEVIVIYDGL
jgi:hypothetical protein